MANNLHKHRPISMPFDRIVHATLFALGYSAVCILFTVNYQVMLHEQFGQMALLLVDVYESYWP